MDASDCFYNFFLFLLNATMHFYTHTHTLLFFIHTHSLPIGFPDGVRLPTIIGQRAQNGNLLIKNVQRTVDRGAYTCVARTKHNCTTQRTVEIKALGEC